MTDKNVYILVGDRFSCISKKKHILNDLSKNGTKWITQDVTKNKKEEICNIINSCPIIGPNCIALIHEGFPSDSKSIFDILSKIQKDLAFFIIFDSIGKGNKIPKDFEENIIKIESVLDQNGYIDYKKINLVKKQIMNDIKWEGAENIFDYIFSSCGYDTGNTISEIEKIRIFLGRNNINSIDEISKILFKTKINTVDDFLTYIFEKDIIGCLEIYNNKDLMESIEKNAYGFFFSIADKIRIISSCFLEIEKGETQNREIFKTVSEILTVDKKYNEYYIGMVFNKFSKYKNKIELNRLFHLEKSAIKSLEDITYSKLNNRYIFNRFITEVF
jgi:hypothetical protein